MDPAASGDPFTKANITTNADGWFQAVSPSFLALIGRPVEGLAGLNLIDLVHPTDAAEARRLIGQVAAGSSVATAQVRLFVAGDRWTNAALSARGVGDQRVIIDIIARVDGVEPAVAQVATQAAPTVSPDTAATYNTAPAQVEPATAAAPVASNDPHQQYVSSLAGQGVPEQRQAERLRAGGDAVPMIEVDQHGRTIFVSGPWDSLLDETSDGPADISAHVLESTGQVDAIADAMGKALELAEPSIIEVSLGSVGQRWLHVLPIPSPHRSGVTHALLAVTNHAHIEPRTAPLTAASAAEAKFGSETAPAVVPVAPAPASTPTQALASESPAVTAAPSDAPPAAIEDPIAVPTPPQLVLQERVRARLEPLAEWAGRRELSPKQIGVVLGVLLIALVLRVWDLDELPTGFHGDEAITGQEAQRILDQGSIGVYTGSALGQPTAPFYLHAIAVGLFGNTIWATRIVAAIAGVAAVALTYLVVQKRFDHRTAIASALGMALMTWTIHFSRIGFGVAWWPFIVLAAIAAIDRATHEMTGRAWFIAGGLATFGLYVYNSHSVFAVAVVGFMVVWLIAKWSWLDFSKLKTLAWGPVGAFVIGLPMLTFALDEKNQFFNHFNLVSRRSTDEWMQLGFFGKIQFVIGRYIDSWDALLVSPVGDGADAAGVIKQVPWIFTLLAIVGIVTVLRRHRTPFVGLLLTTLAALPLVPAMTFNAETRRDYGMAACVAILAGIGAIALLDWAQKRFKWRDQNPAIAALLAVVFFTSVVPYFTTFRNDQSQKWVFAEELTATVRGVELAQQDGPVFVNWYSGRHYFDYPTLQFLLEGVPGADRAPVHEGYNEDPPLELSADVDRDQVYVFIGDYGNNLEELQAMYPQGQLLYDQPNPRVVVFEVPFAS